MRWFILLMALTLSAPLFAQEKGEKEDATKEKKEAQEPQMTAEGKRLIEDVERVYAEYYRIVFEKIKAGESYKADEVWDTAAKKAQNAKYKDRIEFQEAVVKMKSNDRLFKQAVDKLSSKHAEEHKTAVSKWRESQGK